MPEGVGAVVGAAKEALEDEPVLAHDGSGFDRDLRRLDRDTLLVLEDEVDEWSVDGIETELRGEFGGDTVEVDIGGFELALIERTDVRLVDDDSRDAVMRAVGRLASEDHYVLASGSELLKKARSDATLRDVSDARPIDAGDVRSRLEEAIRSAGQADTDMILTTIRGDGDVYLPLDDTDNAFRGAVSTLLSEGFRLETGSEYVGSLGDRDPTAVTVVPMVPEEVGERILEYVGEFEDEETFQVASVREACAPKESEAAVRYFLLTHLGESDTRYVIGATGSTDPTEWFPGAGFRVMGNGWTFPYRGDSAADLRREWQETHESGSVTHGSISFSADGNGGAPASLADAATFDQTHTDLMLEPGQSHDIVADVLENVPESATNIDVTIEFE
jgi:hypothetical protein